MQYTHDAAVEIVRIPFIVIYIYELNQDIIGITHRHYYRARKLLHSQWFFFSRDLLDLWLIVGNSYKLISLKYEQNIKGFRLYSVYFEREY